MIEQTILYIHGMGGGGDSRIPSIIKENIDAYAPSSWKVNVVVRTYPFDPEEAAPLIATWVDELKPRLIVGESLGSIQAIRIKGLPHIFVSPSLGAPFYLWKLSFLTLIPGVEALCDWIWKPRPGDRQTLHFSYKILRKYHAHLKEALANTPLNGSRDYFFAFFGAHDHYRRTGVVSIRLWNKYFGRVGAVSGNSFPHDSGAYTIYDGTHFMEENFVHSLLIPKILEVLGSL